MNGGLISKLKLVHQSIFQPSVKVLEANPFKGEHFGCHRAKLLNANTLRIPVYVSNNIHS
jgi:hypothetical protein